MFCRPENEGNSAAVLCHFAKKRQIDRLEWGQNQGFVMSDAQLGLLLAAPIIIIFAIALKRMGVLQGYSSFAAVVFSVAIAGVLFWQQ
jgi:hypothetical protein